MGIRNQIKELANGGKSPKQSVEAPLVSIIIPVFNRESLLPKTLQNLVDNRYRPLEVILVNDGSTDNSLKILEEFRDTYESKDLMIKVFDQANQGAPVARNLGYDNSTGEYIQFLDSDDLIDEEKFSLQIKSMKKQKADFGLCDFEFVYPREKRKIYHSNSKKLKKIINAVGSFGCGSPLLKRELSDKIRWNEELNRQQDVDYFLKAALLAENIAYVEKPLYYYINHDRDRISNRYNKTNPIYLLRIKSILPLLWHNVPKTARAVYHLSSSYIKHKWSSVFISNGRQKKYN